ncbi:Bifunctional epoxide hydrolase 2 [Hondaea fermentalgiana]|uniref:Bifunctional epoxide hydrolase 2 n=1 Tax=Hondaea fermentalgiana TaxID=2315210 RepID=A0A2R5GX92_9STRA|nr:Bifunctional epoxide hydrolase 2 [Hondaea fermentalgiana]|eukprot:GBG33031.1 Bifunctional epoxide hydrolase 2 [Hondaea fermentalgiana]
MYERMRPAWEAAGCKGPIEYLMTQPSEACGQLDYTVYFNIPEIPERELEADVRKTIYAFFRSQVSGDRRKDFENMKVGMRTAKARKDNNRGVLHHCPPQLERDPLWSAQEMQEYIDAFTRTGFTPPLNWYRCTDANVAWDREEKVYERKVKVPCLMVTAEHDVVLSPETSRGMDALFENLERDHVVAGHWVQREAEADVNRILTAWISKRSDAAGPQSKI